MTTMEKWNAIVDDVQKNGLCKEEIVQKLWEDLFADADIFGYSKRNGEVVVHQRIQVGSHDTAIPDIIIRDNVSDKNLFVVELKQHSLTLNSRFNEQFFTYMRVLKLKVGILICDKLYIYYCENFDTELSTEIEFKRNNPDGESFVKLFEKGAFDQNNIKNYLAEVKTKKSNEDKIKNDVQQLDIKALLIKYYSEKYPIDDVRSALKRLRVSISFDEEMTNPILTVKPTMTPPCPVSLGYKCKISKQEAVQAFVNLGYKFVNKPTYASKNKGVDNYWANPNITVLHNDWYLILNDWLSKTLYLFIIPSYAIHLDQLVVRRDNQNQIDLQIKYNDPLFTDRRSGISFKPYMVKQIKY